MVDEAMTMDSCFTKVGSRFTLGFYFIVVGWIYGGWWWWLGSHMVVGIFVVVAGYLIDLGIFGFVRCFGHVYKSMLLGSLCSFIFFPFEIYKK
jgi:hypothetical protein